MRAEEQIQQPAPRRIWKVSVWKHELDPESRWWQKLFHRYVYLPFQDFSFGVMKIPTTKEVTVESDGQGNIKRTFHWFEDVGFYDHPEQADAACLTERYGYCGLPYGQLMPFQSAQCSGTIFPRRQKGARRWAKPQSTFLFKERAKEERDQRTIKDFIAELNQVLDQ